MEERLLKVLKDIIVIVDNSTGVTNYHLNGDVAEWDEFDVIQEANDLTLECAGIALQKSTSNCAIPVVIESEAAVCVKAKHQIHAINGIYTFCPDCGTKL